MGLRSHINELFIQSRSIVAMLRDEGRAVVLTADLLGRPLTEGELFLLSVTNLASFDSQYFGPVSASVVIGFARPVWLETRP